MSTIFYIVPVRKASGNFVLLGVRLLTVPRSNCSRLDYSHGCAPHRGFFVLFIRIVL